MAIIQYFGYLSQFIIFTTNQKQVKIKKKLSSGWKVIDRPDLITYIFHLKKRELL